MTEQIDIVNITRRVLSQWFQILMISIIAALLVGIAAIHSYQPMYQTQAIITVYGRNSYGSVVYDAQDTADVFKEVITSNLLQKKVAQEMGIDSLPGNLSCANVPYTNMITLTASAGSPKDAMVVIDGVLKYHSVVTEQLLGDMVLQVLESPMVPTEPVEAFNELAVLIKAFLITAVALSAILFLIFYMRDDIKNEAQVEKKLDTKLFATIYHEDVNKGFRIFHRKSKKKRKGILVTNPITSFGYIETFQKMCMRLEYKTKEKQQKSIVVTSLKENEGKSTISVNLALSLAKMGKKVLLMDMDMRKPALFKLMEVAYEKGDPQIGDVLSGKAQPTDAIRKVQEMELYILAGNRSYRNSASILSRPYVQEFLHTMKQQMDYIIIDTPPVDVVADAEEIMRYVDAGLLVVKQNNAIAKDINDTIDVFRSTKCELLGCVFNDVESGFIGSRIIRNEGYNSRYGYNKRYSKRYEKRD